MTINEEDSIDGEKERYFTNGQIKMRYILTNMITCMFTPVK